MVGIHTPRDLADSGIKPSSLMSPALASRFFTTSNTCMLCLHAQSLVMSISLQPYGHRPPGAFLSMGFSRQEYWSGLSCPSPRVLPDLGIEPATPASPTLQAGSLPTESPGKHLGVIQMKGTAFQGCLFWLECVGSLRHMEDN